MKITDEMLYRHVAEARDIWLDTLPDDSEIPEHQFSDGFNTEMNRLIILSHKRKQPSRKLQRIAAMFAVIIIGASSFIGVNAEARAAVIGWIKEVTGTYFVYRYEGEADVAVVPEDYRPAWLPDGYSLFDDNERNGRRSIIYANETGEFIKYHCWSPQSTATGFVGVENATQQSVVVNGHQADLFISNDSISSNCIAWTDEHSYTHVLHAFLDEEELIKLAESVKVAD